MIPESFTALLDAMGKRPGIYLGTASFTKLQLFFAGYFYARQQSGLRGEPEEIMGGFIDWLQMQYQTVTNNGIRIIAAEESMDDERALKRFFERFNEFRKEMDSVGLEVIKRQYTTFRTEHESKLQRDMDEWLAQFDDSSDADRSR